MPPSVALPSSQRRQPAGPKPTPGRCGPSDELELRGDFDAAADALGNRAAARVERMRSLRRLAFVLRAAGEVIANVDALDHEHLVLDDHDTLGIRGRLSLAGADPPPPHPPPKGPGEATAPRRAASA